MAFQPFLFLRTRKGSSMPGVWTVVYEDAAGKKRQRPTKFRGPEGKAKAKATLQLFIEGRQRDARVAGAQADGPMTVARWSVQWLDDRQAKDVATCDYRSWLKNHILPVIGGMRLDTVTDEHVDQVMAACKGKLAPRSRRHVYWTMHAMFDRATPKFIERNPCALKPEDLPKKKDANPEWRAAAIFTRDEVVAILTDPRIPIDRRVLYAVMFLAGCRFGEISALKLRHYDRKMRPLGRLHVAFSWNSKRRILKPTKTERTRLVPVHPTLAAILDWWLDVGWAEFMGRPPAADDVLIPTRRGTHRDSTTGWKQLNGERAKNGRTRQVGDLERIGLRPRRQHDARRTFITLARGDGARKDLLRLVTHGPEGDIIDIYTEMPWAPLCAEVAKLSIDVDIHGTENQGCQEVAMSQIVSGIESFGSDPSGIRKRLSPLGAASQETTPIAKRRGPAGIAPPGAAPNDATADQKRPMATQTATLATLALRQALAAIDRGRVDQAREILKRAIESEAIPEQGAAS